MLSPGKTKYPGSVRAGRYEQLILHNTQLPFRHSVL